jgi:NTE family protein
MTAPGLISEGGSDPRSAIWIVMGGGAVKGLAHLGAWQAIRESGIAVAGIIGTSTGAMIGAAIAAGRSIEEMEADARSLRRRDIIRLRLRAIWLNGIRAPSVFRGDVLRAYVDRFLRNKSWGDLAIPLLVNAVDLATGEMLWFGHQADQGVTLVEAVQASSSLPVLFPPVNAGGRLLVDGGVQEMLPLQKAADMGATRIIAIDVGAGPESDASAVVPQGLVAVHERVFTIMAGQKRRDALQAWSGVPLTTVLPDLQDVGGFDFDRADYLLEEGYRATRVALTGLSKTPS